MGIVGGVGGGEQAFNARTRPCEGVRMSVWPSCDHVAARLDHRSRGGDWRTDRFEVVRAAGGLGGEVLRFGVSGLDRSLKPNWA